MTCRFGQVFAEGFAGRPHIYKSELKVLLCWLDVSHQMCHRPDVPRMLRRFYMKPLLSACGPWSSSGCVCKECVALPCQQIFLVDMSLFRPVQKGKHHGKRKKVESHKGKCCYLWNIDDLKSLVPLGKNRKNNTKTNSTISVPSSACFHLIFKWVLF